MHFFTKRPIIYLIVTLFVILLLYIFISWYYPFSNLNFNKNYNISPDKVVAEQYERDLNNLIENYEGIYNNKTNDLTIIRMDHGLIDLYNKSFLKKNSIDFSFQDLDVLKIEVKETRNTLLDLTFTENYNEETKNYLKLVILSLLKIEDNIQELKLTNNTYSYKELDRFFSELQWSFYSSLKNFISFYHTYNLYND